MKIVLTWADTTYAYVMRIGDWKQGQHITRTLTDMEARLWWLRKCSGMGVRLRTDYASVWRELKHTIERRQSG